MKSKREYIESQLDLIKRMIAENKPNMEIARALGVKYSTYIKHIKALGINYNGNPKRKGIKHLESRKSAMYYIENKISINASILRKKLIEDGIKEPCCEKCGRTEWEKEKIPLELHHKDFNHYNNDLDNLQILCPNCHSLIHLMNNKILKEEKDKNRNEYIKNIQRRTPKTYIKICKHCGTRFQTVRKEQKYCSNKCYSNASIKQFISKEELIQNFKKIGSFKGMGEKYGISDKAISKKFKKYNLPYKVRDLKKLLL